MTRVVVDLERVKFLQCGLGQYSLHLGRTILQEAGDEFEPILLIPRGAESLFHLPGPAGGHHTTPGGEYPLETITATFWRKDIIARWFRPIAGRWPFRRRIDVWHVTHQDSKYWPADPRVPVVLTIHDLNFLREKPPAVIRRRLARLARKIARATALTTGSAYAAREIAEHLPLGDKPMHVIPHGVCLDRAATPRPPATVDPASRFLFTIGDITPKKNFHVLVELLAELPEYSLVIAGAQPGDYAAGIERRAAELGLAERVVLPGRVSESERNWLYEHCAAFVFPSLTEGFGLPLIEAMSHGRPVFSSRRTSLPEVGGPWTFYWDAFDGPNMAQVFQSGMQTYHADPQYADRLREWSRQFRWPVATRRYLDLYRAIASRK